MLKKEIKVSDSKKQIEEILAAEVLENVKKGVKRQPNVYHLRDKVK